MKIIAEISLYPLTEKYGDAVLSFIKALQSHTQVRVRSNSMSTQVAGAMSDVMRAIEDAYTGTFDQAHKSILVMKLYNEGLEMEWLDI